MKIQNISMEECRVGDHIDFGPNTVLIQITDPDVSPPIPAKEFHSVFHFEFLDIDQSDIDKHDDSFGEFAITDNQAQKLVNILKFALEKNFNVIVHCHAGVCRSGAVVEVGEQLGFEKCTRFRAPNLLVKHKMFRCLGWTYDSEEKPYMTNSCEEDHGNEVRSSFGLWS